MRKAGLLTSRKQSDEFIRFLSTQGINAESQKQTDDSFQIWVEEEDRISEVREQLKLFATDPQNKIFQVSKKKSAVKKVDRSRFVNVRRDVFGSSSGYAPVTLTLILLSIFATFILDLPTYKWLKYKLYYSEYMGKHFYEIKSGQVWRIITPIFMHGGFLHIVFNMLWLHQLSTQIEKIEGSRYILLFVMTLAAIANTGQYLVSGPLFVGMSGVVYGLLGYIWMMTKYKYNSAYTLSPGTVVFMVIWMIICLVGIIPNVANTEHVLGFFCGTIWGFWRSGGLKSEWRRYLYKRNR